MSDSAEEEYIPTNEERARIEGEFLHPEEQADEDFLNEMGE
jgi:hypothetical protein